MSLVRVVEASNATWEEHYKCSSLPWKSGGVCATDLVVLKSHAAETSSVLEVGCGDGSDSKSLSELGGEYLGLDFSQTAVTAASKSHPNLSFEEADFFTWKPCKPYGIAYDKGVFHGLGGQSRREAFAEHMASLLVTDGIWLSVCGAADRRRNDVTHGAVYLTDFVTPVEVFFEIVDVRKAKYGLIDASLEFEAWHILSRRR